MPPHDLSNRRRVATSQPRIVPSVLVLFALLALPSVAAAAGADWIPPGWKAGASLAGERVTKVESHEEFVRIHTERGGFELVACLQPDDPWCAQGVRIQPLPGAKADEAWLRGRLDEIRAHKVDAQAPVAPIGVQRGPDDAAAMMDHLRGVWPWEAVYAIVLALLGIVVALRASAGDPRVRRWVWATAGLAAATPLLGRTLLGEQTVQLQSVMRMHEGNALTAATTLVAPYVFESQGWLLTDATGGVAGIVAANRLLSSVALLGTFTWLLALLRSLPWAVFATLLAFKGSMAWSIMTSETHTPVIWVAMLPTVAAVALHRRADSLRWERSVAWLFVALLPPVFGRRQEVGLLWAVALWMMATAPHGPAHALAQRWWRRAVDFARAQRPNAARWLFVWLLLGTVNGGLFGHMQSGAFAALQRLVGEETAEALHHPLLASLSLQPFDLSFVFLPGDAASAFGLLGCGLLLWGIVRSFVDGRGWLLLGLAVLAMYKVFRFMGHGFHYEMQRYIATLVPVCGALIAVGLRDALLRGEPLLAATRHRRLAVGSVVLLALLDPRYAGDSRGTRTWPRPGLQQGDLQSEFVAMSTAVGRYPECAIVTRNTDEVDGDGVPTRQSWIVFGAPWPSPHQLRDEAEIPAALAGLQPAPRCALVFDGLECRAADGVGCDGIAEGDVVDRYSSDVEPYRHLHWGKSNWTARPHTLRSLARRLRPAGPLRDATPPAPRQGSVAALPPPELHP
ncbi:MAG: hypothetical protein H6747_14280 [Deltaproteobacteria bacterium]|nr:hypothetical protein [Deltaproteobacteria bacterium]